MFLLSQDYWEVKNTKNKGRGVFAKKDISAGTVIGDYIGKLILDVDYSDEKYGGVYDMYYNTTTSIVADKNTTGVHLINHSCSANCDVFPYEDRAIFFACRHIFSGEELTIQYLLNPPEKNHICNHACYCGSPICYGTMHTNVAITKAVKKFVDTQTSKKINKTPVLLNQLLPPLSSYPKNIPDYAIYDLYGCLTEKPLEMDDQKLPTIEKIREKIRNSGRILHFSELNLYIYGIANGLIIGTENIKGLYNNS